MAVRYIQRWDNEWVDVTFERSVVCCDCGLVHKEKYRVIENDDGRFSIIRQAIRDNRATAARRRSLKARKEGLWSKKKK